MVRNYVTTVRQNDTLQSIAHRFTKDPNRWHEIVVANSYLPKKTRMVNGRPLATLSDLFVGQKLVLPGHWFGSINTTSTMCPQGFHWDNASQSCISNISGSGIANGGTTSAAPRFGWQDKPIPRPTCPPGYQISSKGMCECEINQSGQTSGAIGCGSSCTAREIREGNCKDFNMKQFMGVSGPPSYGSLG